MTRPFNKLSAGWYFNLCGVWAALDPSFFWGELKIVILGGQKRAFLGGPKSPILARGHMGKTADFNQIVLYLETPNLVEYGLKTPQKTNLRSCKKNVNLKINKKITLTL